MIETKQGTEGRIGMKLDRLMQKDGRFMQKHGTMLKFGIVGASGVIVNNGVLLLLVSLGMDDLAASIIATETAIITNFLGNSFWTWGDQKDGSWAKRFLMFQGISIFAAVLTVALFWAFHNIVGMPLLIANTIAILITFIINYVLNKKFTWGAT
jgi:dolichol-phosphate mannosyltransferase